MTTASVQYTSAGLWTPVPATDVTSSWNGGLANTFSQLVPLGPAGAYGLVLDGWAFPNPTPQIPFQVNLDILTPNGAGGVTANTSAYLTDASTWGAQSVLVGDFNGDGRPDVVLPAHNEDPFVAEPGVALMSNASGGFTKVALPGRTMAHDAEITVIDGQLAITTATFSPGDANPIFTYKNGAWVENLSPSLNQAGFGMSEQIGQFAGTGKNELVRGDVGFDYTSPGIAAANDIAVYGFDGATLSLTSTSQIPQPLQKIVPYLSTLPQYANVLSLFGAGLTHTYRLWSIDLNNDGHPDLLAGESMWSSTSTTYPTALQVLINNGDGTFVDRTAALNPSMSLSTDELDYNPTILDIDHSGIASIMFSSTTAQGASRQANYLLLNDGTGRLYVAVHDQFVALNQQVTAYVAAQYPPSENYYVDTSGLQFSKFIALPQPDGSLNYVAEVPISQKNPTTGNWGASFALVNVPLHYNPSTDFVQNITVADRNGSSLIRTWAGDDTFYDVNSGPVAHIDGGLGLNTSIYSGSLHSYAVEERSDGSVTVRASGSSVPQVNDTLVNVQSLKFADTTITVPNPPARSDIALVFDLHSAQDLLVYEIYQAAYGRTPDNGGFRYWANVADATKISATAIADSFLAAPEFAQIYGANPTNSTYVTGLYTHVLGRTPDSGGLAYWAGQADAGLARDQLLVAFATSAENVQLIGSHVSNGYWTTA